MSIDAACMIELEEHEREEREERLRQKMGGAAFATRLTEICKLTRSEYLYQRQDLARELSIPVSLLDAEHKKAEKKGGESAEFIVDPVLWDEPVNGAELLDEITDAAKRGEGRRGSKGPCRKR